MNNTIFGQKLGHLLHIERSDNSLTRRTEFSVSKIAYFGLWLMFEFDLVDPTQKKWETHAFLTVQRLLFVI